MLILSRLFQEQIYDHAKKFYPYECCGALLGTLNENRRTTSIVELANKDAQRKIKKSYTIEPEDLLQLTLKARKTGNEILGFYHSHPDGISIPSETDRKMAWSSYSYLIVSLGQSSLFQFRSWLLTEDGKNFEEETIHTPTTGPDI